MLPIRQSDVRIGRGNKVETQEEGNVGEKGALMDPRRTCAEVEGAHPPSLPCCLLPELGTVPAFPVLSPPPKSSRIFIYVEDSVREKGGIFTAAP